MAPKTKYIRRNDRKRDISVRNGGKRITKKPKRKNLMMPPTIPTERPIAHEHNLFKRETYAPKISQRLTEDPEFVIREQISKWQKIRQKNEARCRSCMLGDDSSSSDEYHNDATDTDADAGKVELLKSYGLNYAKNTLVVVNKDDDSEDHAATPTPVLISRKRSATSVAASTVSNSCTNTNTTAPAENDIMTENTASAFKRLDEVDQQYIPPLSALPIAYLSANQDGIKNWQGYCRMDVWCPAGRVGINMFGLKVESVKESSILKGLVLPGDVLFAGRDELAEHLKPRRKLTFVGIRRKNKIPLSYPPVSATADAVSTFEGKSQKENMNEKDMKRGLSQKLQISRKTTDYSSMATNAKHKAGESWSVLPSLMVGEKSNVKKKRAVVDVIPDFVCDDASNKSCSDQNDQKDDVDVRAKKRKAPQKRQSILKKTKGGTVTGANHGARAKLLAAASTVPDKSERTKRNLSIGKGIVDDVLDFADDDISDSSHSDSDDNSFHFSPKRKENRGLHRTNKSTATLSGIRSGKKGAKRGNIQTDDSSKTEEVRSSAGKDGDASQEKDVSTINSIRGVIRGTNNNVTVKTRFGRSANKEPPPFDGAIPLTKKYVGVARMDSKAPLTKKYVAIARRDSKGLKKYSGLPRDKKLSLLTKKLK